ncbi:MAG: HprK-related kinase B, partial [Nannocystaceae bacterium]
MTETSSLASYAASLEALAPATHRVPLVLHGDVYIVRCDDPTLAETLRRYFAPFVDEDVDASSAVEICAYQRTPPTFDDAELITPPLGRGTKRLKEQYVDRADGRFVLKTRTGMVFGFGGGRNVAVGPCDENPNQVINFINNRLMSRALDDGAVLTHAAAIARGDAAIAIAGFSGMGKSTTALHLM